MPSRATRIIVIVISTLLVACCLCDCLFTASFIPVAGVGIVVGWQEMMKAQGLVDEFMHAMANDEIETAYALLSAQAQEAISPAELKALMNGETMPFSGYQNTTASEFSASCESARLKDEPPYLETTGCELEIRGNIRFLEFSGRFNAILKEENGEWKLLRIAIPTSSTKKIEIP